jgi:photosystem II stability/assembly factor-like uncharacterized protein
MYERAEVLRSTDGGYTFVSNTYPESGKQAKGFCVSPSGVIYLCGTDGTVLHSKDNGASFQFNRIHTWDLYVGVAYPVDDTGIFINTVVQEIGTIQQVDSNYNVIDKQSFKFGLNDIYMVSPSTGYVVGYGAILKTTDHRRTWHFLNLTGDNFMCMDRHGSELWVCGYNGGIYHSLDAGANWTKVRNGSDITIPRYHLYGIAFRDPMQGWAVGEQGKVIYTKDAGKHWSEYEHFTNSTLRAITICLNGDLLIAGDNGVIFRVIP